MKTKISNYHILKRVATIILLFCSIQIIGQNEATMTHDELNTLVYRNIMKSCTTSFLLNLSNAQSSVFGLSETNRRNQYQNADDWLLAYNDMVQSYIPEKNIYKNINTFYHNVVQNKYKVNTRGTQDIIQLPLGVIFQDYNYVDVASNLENKKLYVEANDYTLNFKTHPNNVIDKKTVFTANIIAKELSIYERLRIQLTDEYILSGEHISKVILYRNNTLLGTLHNKSHLDITILEGTNRFKVVYQSADNKTWTSEFVIEGKSLTPVTPSSRENNPFSLFNIVTTASTLFTTENINNKPQRAKIKIFYGCENTEKKLKKPAIMVSGFNPVNIQGFPKLVSKFNTNGYLTALHNRNYDVVIIRFNYGADRIENQALLTHKIIKYLNYKKMENGSFFENIISGYSSGAVVARMALKMMEKSYANSPIIENHHHSKLLISYDGEHQGANIPLSAQHGAISIIENPQWYLPLTGILGILDHYFLISSPAAKDFLMYHYTQTGNANNPSQGAHPFFHQTHTKLNNEYFYNSVDYNKPGNYPMLRNVGISDGAATIISHPLDGQSPLLKIEKNINIFGWKRHNYMEWRPMDGHGHMVFKRVFKKKKLWQNNYTTLLNEEKHVTNASKKIDGVQGSTMGLYNGIRNFVKATYLQFNPPIDVKSTDCFLPTVSALDINHDTFEYDLRQHNLLLNDKQYGYPSMHYGDQQYERTPFDAIYAATTNVKHGAASEDLPQTPLLTEFMLDEVQHEDLWLQYLTIGTSINNQYHYYPVTYEAVNTIRCGKNVTDKTQHKPFNVKEKSEVTMKAGKSISFEPGVDISYGSVLAAHIEPVTMCTISRVNYVENKSSFDDPHNKNKMKMVETPEVITRDVYIYPNPNNGKFTITSDGKLGSEFYIYTTTGIMIKHIKKQKHQNKININTLDQGVYFIKMKIDDVSVAKKIMIQKHN
jgi:hypothetical protein